MGKHITIYATTMDLNYIDIHQLQISDCIVIPSELACEDFLAQYAMFFSLKQSAKTKQQFSDQLKSCFDNQWCIWWMERTMCQENEIIAYKNGYYCTPIN